MMLAFCYLGLAKGILPMRAIQFGKWLIAVLAGAIYTIIQTGPETAGQNLCRLVRTVVPSISENCVPSFQQWGPLAILLLAIVFGVLGLIDLVPWLRKRAVIKPRRASHSSAFIGAMEAIYWIAERSAWGRWMEAQYRASGKAIAEIFKLTNAEQFFRRSAENGEIVVKARLAKSVEFTSLDQHFWQSAYFDIKENLTSIWAATIKARSPADVEIPEYDAAIVERTRVETLWPRRDWRYDWPAFWINIRLAWARMTEQKPNDTQKRNEGEAAQPPANTVASAAPVTHHVAATAKIGIQTSVSADAKVQISVTPYAPENWERLFAIGDDGRSIWLKFLPDTKNYRADTLVLIAYGQKVLRDVGRIKVDAAHAAVEKSISNAPNQPHVGSGLLLTMWTLGRLQAATNLDWVDQCVPLYLERVGLSQGGFYQLTEAGEQHAATLAYDLIRRA